MIVDNDSILELQKLFPSAVVAAAYRENITSDSRRFIVELPGGAKRGATSSYVAQILALFFGRQPALSFNRLLPLADLAAGTARGAATPVLPLAGYTDLIVNLHAASDGAQHVLIALNVGGERHDAEHIASVERDFLRVTTRIFSKLAAEPLPTQPLTSREQDILVWVHEGKSNWVIGQIVGVSEHTVKHSVSSILKKYGVLSRRHLPRVQAKTASTM